MIYRFLKTGRFRRILFLVDRTSLGEQAADVFREVKLEDLMTLDDIYNIKALEDKEIDRETRIQVATVQSMVKRIVYNSEDTMPSVSDFDLVIIDEAHRGYILDREMGEDTEDNFTGTIVYDFADAYLRYGTVKKLAGVQTELLTQGYSLKIWDAYRPVSAQFKLWEICPDPVYVANPNTGYSSHSRGNTVDVTLVLADGTEIEMPTGFDDFSTLADRDYSDVPADATGNVLILENMMKDYGFNCYSGEWWHYSDSSTYPVVQN